jgi:hydroxymethylbilane synthase
MKKIRVGTRGSLLAVRQTGMVIDDLSRLNPGYSFEVIKIKTQGDIIQDVPLSQVGGKGLFVKEIEKTLLDGEIDLAVHSMKDMPADLPHGLVIGAVPERVDPRDALISGLGTGLGDLPAGTVVGTSSLRRVAQLKAYRPDLEMVSLRGNVDTRLRKLEEGQVGAIIMATAGLTRLGLRERITGFISPEVCLPAVGQGALAIEMRDNDHDICRLVESIHHRPTCLAVAAERAFLARLEGGCQVPIAGYARHEGDRLEMEGLVATPKGERILRRRLSGDPENPEGLGIELAELLLAEGAGEILQYGRS